MLMATSALRVPASGVIDEDPAHDLRRHGKEMRPVLPLNPGEINQPHIGLIDQRGGLQAVTVTLTSEVPAREAPELVVDDGGQAVEGFRIPAAPGVEQTADVAGGTGWFRSPWHRFRPEIIAMIG